MVARRTAARRPAALIFVLAWLAVIAAATLVPAVSFITLPATCIICGPLGGVDFVLNVGLFLPLGAGLFAMGRRVGFAALCGLVVTLLIEVLQWRVIPGRDASLGDVVANSLGAMLGALMASSVPIWIRATGTKAHRLGVASAVCAGGAILASAWLVLPSHPDNVVTVQWMLSRPHLDMYSGAVHTMRLNHRDVFPTARIPPASIVRETGGSILVEAIVDGPTGATRRPAMIVALANMFEEGLFLGQQGTAVVFRAHSVAARLRFRSPFFRLDSAFPGHGDSLVLMAEATPAFVRMRRTGGGAVASIEYLRTAGLAWTAFLPWDVSLTPAWWPVNALWLAILVLPFGFWAAAGGRTPARTWWLGVLPLAAVVAGPLAFGVAWPMPGEWGGLVGGMMAGIAAQRLTRRAIRG